MSDPVYEVIIPFRDRGTDPLRQRNLARVIEEWEAYGASPLVVTDGGEGDAQFNRSRAYNRGVAQAFNAADVFIFAESDMLVPYDQMDEACELADKVPGLVVPFTQYCYQGPENSEMIRVGAVDARECKPQWTMDNRTSIGAVNVVSRRTMEYIGQWDECFEGNWYDDDAMKIAFEMCTGTPTRFVEGRADHLYHLPGHRGEHLTMEDKLATRRNKDRLALYRRAESTRNVATIRRLLAGLT